MGHDLGIDAADGQKTWTALDAAFKQHEYKASTDVLSGTGFDTQAFIDFAASTGTVSQDVVTGLDLNAIKTRFDNETSSMVEAFKTDNPDKKAEDLFASRKIVKETLGLLPSGLPANVNVKGVGSEENAVPSSRREKATISLGTLSVTKPISELLGKRLTVSYIGSTQADRDIVAEYGSIDQAPAYLINMTPVIRIDGEGATGTASAPMAANQTLNVTISTPRGDSTLSHRLTVGGFYSIVLAGGRIPTQTLAANNDQLKTQVDEVKVLQDDPNYQANLDADIMLGQMMNLTGLMYFNQLDSVSDLMVATSKINDTKHTSELLAGTSTKVASVFDVPTRLSPSGAFIDVAQEVHSIKAKDGDQAKEKAYSFQFGMMSSYLEHVALEQTFGIEAMSTMKVIQIANNSHIPIYTITQENIAQIMPQLTLAQDVKDDIQNAVNSGNTVITPKDDIAYYGWQGTGYVVLDPDTYAGGYMISGGLAGGGTTDVDSRIDWQSLWETPPAQAAETTQPVSPTAAPSNMTSTLFKMAIGALVTATFLYSNRPAVDNLWKAPYVAKVLLDAMIGIQQWLLLKQYPQDIGKDELLIALYFLMLTLQLTIAGLAVSGVSVEAGDAAFKAVAMVAAAAVPFLLELYNSGIRYTSQIAEP